MRRTASRLLAVLATAAALGGLPAVPAAASECPGGGSPCVWLPGGTYTLRNPVKHDGGVEPSTTAVAHHCDRMGRCYDVLLSLPGLTLTSTSNAILTLTVPDAGVELVGATPTLHIGNPEVTPAGGPLGVTLTVSGTPFVIWDTFIEVAWACTYTPVPPVSENVSGRAGLCSFTLTVSV